MKKLLPLIFAAALFLTPKPAGAVPGGSVQIFGFNYNITWMFDLTDSNGNLTGESSWVLEGTGGGMDFLVVTGPSNTQSFQNFATNNQTASCSDPRVFRGTGTVGNGSTQYTVPVAAMGFWGGDENYSPYVEDIGETLTFTKNGKAWNGKGNVAAGDTVTMSEGENVLAGYPQTEQRYTLTMTGLNAANIACVNSDGTSCGITVTLKTPQGTQTLCD